MGLEMVELLMSVEEEFGITIADSDYDDMRTVGGLHAVVCERLRLKPGVPPDEDEVWRRLLTLIRRLFDRIPPGALLPTTRFYEDLGFG